MKLFSFWQNIDNDRKNVISFISAVICIIVSVFLGFAIISYFFTWEADQSVIQQGSSVLGDVENYGGQQGSKIAHVLVSDLFGMSALIIPVLLLFIGLKCMSVLKSVRMLPTLMLSISLLFFSSWLLAFISISLHLVEFLNGRLGGQASEVVVDWLIHMFGAFPTLFFLVSLIIIWLFFLDFNILLKIKDYLVSLSSNIYIRFKNRKQTDSSTIDDIVQENAKLELEKNRASDLGDEVDILDNEVISTVDNSLIDEADSSEPAGNNIVDRVDSSLTANHITDTANTI